MYIHIYKLVLAAEEARIVIAKKVTSDTRTSEPRYLTCTLHLSIYLSIYLYLYHICI